MNITRISIKMAWLLRHCQTPIYIQLNGGWADVKTIVSVLKQKFPDVTIDVVNQIVAEDEKGRYSFDKSGRKIRANQGHSIPGVVIEMDSPEPPEYLYHGTAYGFLNKVLKEGLKPMTRQYVHISSDYKTALKVGSRHGKPVVLLLRAKDFVKDGNELYLSPNGILQAKTVPPQYFSACYDESTLPTAEEALQLNREENFND